MKSIRKFRTMVASLITMTILVGSMSFCAVNVDACTDGDYCIEKPVITSTVVDAEKGKVFVTWDTSNPKTRYVQVAERNSKKWVQVKSVKKTAANKKKYTKKNVYKVKAKGSKYQVYQFRYTYKNLGRKKPTGPQAKYTFTNLKKGKKYTFAFKSVGDYMETEWTILPVVVK